jgi:hypothetical protein
MENLSLSIVWGPIPTVATKFERKIKEAGNVITIVKKLE